MKRLGMSALVALTVVAIPCSVAAQAHPDFSGYWTVVPRRGPPARGDDARTADLGSGWGPRFTVIQKADSLMVEREFFSPPDLEPPLRFRYALDGDETTNTVVMGRGNQTQRAHARWDGKRLVISVVFTDDTEGVASEVRYTLWYQQAPRDAHPPLLVIETWRGGAEGGASTTTRTVYVRS